MKTHTEAGYKQIMDTVQTLTVSACVAREHHEKLDGSGYHKLPGKNIHPYSRIVSIADVFDALLSKRAYKEPWDVNNIVQYFTEHENHFDIIIVGYLVSILKEVLLLYKSDPKQNIAG